MLSKSIHDNILGGKLTEAEEIYERRVGIICSPCSSQAGHGIRSQTTTREFWVRHWERKF